MFFSLMERYVLRKFLLSLLITTLLTISVIWLVRAIQEVDIVLTKGQSILLYLQITLFGIAPFTIIVLPIALTIAALHTISTLNEGSELTVANAAGFSRSVLLRPLLFISLLVSIFIYALSLWLSPLSLHEMRDRVTEMRTDLVTTVLQAGQFRELTKGVTFHISSREQGGLLKGLFIRDSRTSDEVTYFSDEAYFQRFGDQNFLVLRDGEVHRRVGRNVSIVTFSSYTYDLSTLTSTSTQRGRTHREISTYDLLTKSFGSLPSGSPSGHYRSELHNRLTVGLYPIAFIFWVVALMGFPISSRQGQRGLRIFIFALVTLIRGSGIVVLERSRYLDDAILLVWAIPLLALFLGILAIRYPPNFLFSYLLRRLRLDNSPSESTT